MLQAWPLGCRVMAPGRKPSKPYRPTWNGAGVKLRADPWMIDAVPGQQGAGLLPRRSGWTPITGRWRPGAGAAGTQVRGAQPRRGSCNVRCAGVHCGVKDSGEKWLAFFAPSGIAYVAQCHTGMVLELAPSTASSRCRQMVDQRDSEVLKCGDLGLQILDGFVHAYPFRGWLRSSQSSIVPRLQVKFVVMVI